MDGEERIDEKACIDVIYRYYKDNGYRDKRQSNTISLTTDVKCTIYKELLSNYIS